jgi:hypothetical protein
LRGKTCCEGAIPTYHKPFSNSKHFKGKNVMTPKYSEEKETEDLAKKQDVGMSSKAPMSAASSESSEDPNP